MKKRMVIIGCALCFVFGVQAQGITFSKFYGTGKGYDVQQTAEGGYILVGEGGPFVDIHLIKTNQFGDTLWTKIFSGPYYTSGGWWIDKGHSVRQTKDKGYIIVGFQGVPDWFSEFWGNVWVIKTDSSGNIVWDKVFDLDSLRGDEGFSVVETQDGSYVIAGATGNSLNGANLYAFLMKLDSNGDSLWMKKYGKSGIAYSMQQTQDNGFILTGAIDVTTDIINLLKTDSLGDTLWSKRLGEINYDYRPQSIQETSDKGFIVCGCRYKYAVSPCNVYVAKTDSIGSVLWDTTFGGPDGDIGYSVMQSKDGGYVIAGTTYSFATGSFSNSDIWLIKTTATGDTLWTKTFGNERYDEAYSVRQCKDGGYIITGYANTSIVLIKTDSLGNAPPLPLGIKKNEMSKENDEVKIFPNPFTSSATLRVTGDKGRGGQGTGDKGQGTREFTMYDLLGREMMHSVIHNSDTFVIRRGNLPAGMYFYKVTGDKGRGTGEIIATGKIIIQ